MQTSRNRLAKYKPGIIPAFDPTKKGTRKNTIKPSKNSLAKYKPKSIPAFDPTKKHTRKNTKKGGNKYKKVKKHFQENILVIQVLIFHFVRPIIRRRRRKIVRK